MAQHILFKVSLNSLIHILRLTSCKFEIAFLLIKPKMSYSIIIKSGQEERYLRIYLIRENTVEIAHIFALIFSNIVGMAISTGFGQVSKIKKNSDFFFEGKAYASSQIGELTSILTDECIPIPSSSDCYVTDSTISPFSEKLMMIYSTVESSSGISSLGMAMADTMRSDLQSNYMKYHIGIMKYAKRILITNGWLEQPPQAINHKNLVI